MSSRYRNKFIYQHDPLKFNERPRENRVFWVDFRTQDTFFFEKASILEAFTMKSGCLVLMRHSVWDEILQRYC